MNLLWMAARWTCKEKHVLSGCFLHLLMLLFIFHISQRLLAWKI